MKLVSWNVNGIRAVHKKGFLEWLTSHDPDICCLQEIKALQEQFPKPILEWDHHRLFIRPAVRKGYSGVATFTRSEPLQVETGFGIPEFDDEGRTLVTEFPDFVLYNVYFPNGGASQARLKYKLAFYDAFLDAIEARREQGKPIVICGDVNTAHHPIDLARPKENETSSGFLPEERAWIDRLTERGYVDTFRMFCDKPGHYSWWDYKTRARERNIGWRIDYFFVSAELKDRVEGAAIYPDVMGSDHCPVELALRVAG